MLPRGTALAVGLLIVQLCTAQYSTDEVAHGLNGRELSESSAPPAAPPSLPTWLDPFPENNDSQKFIVYACFIVFGFIICLRVGHCAAGGTPPRVLPVVPKEFLVADALFSEIDTDHSGTVEPKELMNYLLSKNEQPSRVHAILMQLDTNKDGKIDRDEWRQGWLKGVVSSDGVGPAAAEPDVEQPADPVPPAADGGEGARSRTSAD